MVFPSTSRLCRAKSRHVMPLIGLSTALETNGFQNEGGY